MLDGGYEIARLSPPRRRHLGHLGYYAVAANQLDLAVRNTRVLARAAGMSPSEALEALREVSHLVSTEQPALGSHEPHAGESPATER